MSKEKCYWCGAPKTSVEHVPPKCMFPEDKDIKPILNKSFRKNLITVPSCDMHNLNKSGDDQYLMTCLAGRVGNNSTAFLHNKTKIARTVNRDPKLLSIKSEDVISIADKKFPVLWVDVDIKRLSVSFESIARALFYYEFKECFVGECVVISNIFTNPENEEQTKLFFDLCNGVEEEIPYWNSKIKGENPDIFTYQIGPVDGIR